MDVRVGQETTTLPAIAYFQHGIAFTPARTANGQNCADATSDAPCEASLRLPRSLEAFTIETSSVLTQVTCLLTDQRDATLRYTAHTFTPRAGHTPTDTGINYYEYTPLSSAALAVNGITAPNEVFTCNFTASKINRFAMPHFAIRKNPVGVTTLATLTTVHRILDIVRNNVDITPLANCYDHGSSVCTLQYVIPTPSRIEWVDVDLIGLVQDDTDHIGAHVEGKFFSEALQQPQVVLTQATTITYQQDWLKYPTSPTRWDPVAKPLANIKFWSAAKKNLNLYLNPNLLFTFPVAGIIFDEIVHLVWDYDTCTDGKIPVCKLTYKTNYIGPASQLQLTTIPLPLEVRDPIFCRGMTMQLSPNNLQSVVFPQVFSFTTEREADYFYSECDVLFAKPFGYDSNLLLNVPGTNYNELVMYQDLDVDTFTTGEVEYNSFGHQFHVDPYDFQQSPIKYDQLPFAFSLGEDCFTSGTGFCTYNLVMDPNDNINNTNGNPNSLFAGLNTLAERDEVLKVAFLRTITLNLWDIRKPHGDSSILAANFHKYIDVTIENAPLLSDFKPELYFYFPQEGSYSIPTLRITLSYVFDGDHLPLYDEYFLDDEVAIENGQGNQNAEIKPKLPLKITIRYLLQLPENQQQANLHQRDHLGLDGVYLYQYNNVDNFNNHAAVLFQQPPPTSSSPKIVYNPGIFFGADRAGCLNPNNAYCVVTITHSTLLGLHELELLVGGDHIYDLSVLYSTGGILTKNTTTTAVVNTHNSGGISENNNNNNAHIALTTDNQSLQHTIELTLDPAQTIPANVTGFLKREFAFAKRYPSQGFFDFQIMGVLASFNQSQPNYLDLRATYTSAIIQTAYTTDVVPHYDPNTCENPSAPYCKVELRMTTPKIFLGTTLISVYAPAVLSRFYISTVDSLVGAVGFAENATLRDGLAKHYFSASREVLGTDDTPWTVATKELTPNTSGLPAAERDLVALLKTMFNPAKPLLLDPTHQYFALSLTWWKRNNMPTKFYKSAVPRILQNVNFKQDFGQYFLPQLANNGKFAMPLSQFKPVTLTASPSCYNLQRAQLDCDLHLEFRASASYPLHNVTLEVSQIAVPDVLIHPFFMYRNTMNLTEVCLSQGPGGTRAPLDGAFSEYYEYDEQYFSMRLPLYKNDQHRNTPNAEVIGDLLVSTPHCENQNVPVKFTIELKPAYATAPLSFAVTSFSFGISTGRVDSYDTKADLAPSWPTNMTILGNPAIPLDPAINKVGYKNHVVTLPGAGCGTLWTTVVRDLPSYKVSTASVVNIVYHFYNSQISQIKLTNMLFGDFNQLTEYPLTETLPELILNQNNTYEDLVLITKGEMPQKFYNNFRVKDDAESDEQHPDKAQKDLLLAQQNRVLPCWELNALGEPIKDVPFGVFLINFEQNHTIFLPVGQQRSFPQGKQCQFGLHVNLHYPTAFYNVRHEFTLLGYEDVFTTHASYVNYVPSAQVVSLNDQNKNSYSRAVSRSTSSTDEGEAENASSELNSLRKRLLAKYKH